MIQENEIAFLKLTGEAVFVLDIAETGLSCPAFDTTFISKARTLVLVRRPAFTSEKGVVHNVERFRIEELEDETEHRKREQKNFVSLKDQIQAELDRQCPIVAPVAPKRPGGPIN